MEVAGIVLGAFPIGIEGIKCFHSAVNTVGDLQQSRYEFILQQFLQEIEHVAWACSNTCATLLEGLDIDGELSQLMLNPDAPGWSKRDLQIELQKRLPQPGAADCFIITVRQLLGAVEEIRRLLGLVETDAESVKLPVLFARDFV